MGRVAASCRRGGAAAAAVAAAALRAADQDQLRRSAEGPSLRASGAETLRKRTESGCALSADLRAQRGSSRTHSKLSAPAATICLQESNRPRISLK